MYREHIGANIFITICNMRVCTRLMVKDLMKNEETGKWDISRLEVRMVWKWKRLIILDQIHNLIKWIYSYLEVFELHMMES